MIILISGASHVGKTALAQKLLEKYKFPYLSIDHLKMGLIRSGQTSLTPLSDDALLTEYLWPIVREMVKTAIENEQNLIVEGCYIPHNWYEYFSKEYLENIKYRCLILSEKYIKNSFEKYPETCGLDVMELDSIKESIALLIGGKVDFEFRTTVVSPLHTPEDIETLAKEISGAEKYFIQNFVDSGELLGSGMTALPRETLDQMLTAAQKYIPEARLRGV